MVSAIFNLAETIQRHGDLALPVAWVTIAWVFRAISQGAACHYLEQQVLSPTEPTARESWKRAFMKAPSLTITAAHNLVLNSLLVTFTLCLGLLFIGAHNVAYAVTMRGEGSALSIYSTCSKLLGAARHTASWVRMCGIVQFLVAFNLHTGVAGLLWICSNLLGFDVTFAQRFTSLDNSVWFATVVSLTFALFEPIRAATATLLLVDGRVRQEGLDLVASMEQLPRRRKPKAAIVSTLALTLLFAGPAFAQSHRDKIRAVAESCGSDLTNDQVKDIEALPPSEDGSLTRFAARLERTAYDDEDCDSAVEDLKEGLTQLHQARLAHDSENAIDARANAKAILARPEFQNIDPLPKAEEEAKEEEPPGFFRKMWDDFWDAIIKWLKNWKPGERETPDTPTPNLPTSTPEFGADIVVVAAVVLVIAVLAIILWKFRDRKPEQNLEGNSSSVKMSALVADPMSALARPAESWAGLADELAQKGNFREAIRHLYLALLSRLHRDGAIDYDPTNSNWDYLKHFKGPGDGKSRFRELTRRFDFAWYGNLDVHQQSWSSFRGLAEPMLVKTPETADA